MEQNQQLNSIMSLLSLQFALTILSFWGFIFGGQGFWVLGFNFKYQVACQIINIGVELMSIKIVQFG